jgi:hypothetical protein
MNIFKDVKVFPSYGKNSVIVLWHTVDEFRDGYFVVSKSKDASSWVEFFHGENADQALDTDFVVADRLTNYYYKVRVAKNNTSYESDIVATFGPVTREEFGAANVLLQEWGKKIQTGSRIKIYRQLIFGKPCPRCVDQDTGQKVGTTLCEHCFGTGFEHGFSAPVDSWMLKSLVPPRATADMEDGAGTRDVQIFNVRMLAFPSTRRGDLIVDVGNDDRFLVGASQHYDVFGKITILYDTDLELLRRSDIRHKV